MSLPGVFGCDCRQIFILKFIFSRHPEWSEAKSKDPAETPRIPRRDSSTSVGMTEALTYNSFALDALFRNSAARAAISAGYQHLGIPKQTQPSGFVGRVARRQL